MRMTCGTKMTRTKRLKRILDRIFRGHATHKCVHMSPLHRGDHVCICNMSWPALEVWPKLHRKYGG